MWLCLGNKKAKGSASKSVSDKVSTDLTSREDKQVVTAVTPVVVTAADVASQVGYSLYSYFVHVFYLIVQL